MGWLIHNTLISRANTVHLFILYNSFFIEETKYQGQYEITKFVHFCFKIKPYFMLSDSKSKFVAFKGGFTVEGLEVDPFQVNLRGRGGTTPFVLYPPPDPPIANQPNL